MIKVKRPTLIIDRQKCMSNIERMARKANQSGIIFRPHFKTHQSNIVAEWFREFGVDKICVSSVEMAAHFADHGWDDITIAFPLNFSQVQEINELAGRISLNVLVESVEAIELLKEKIDYEIGVFIEIDDGYHRSGLPITDASSPGTLADLISISKKLAFKGFLVHSGQTYHAGNRQQIIDIYDDTLRGLARLKNRYATSFPGLILSIGDTPSCSIMNDFQGVDEIRPGNFVFYDVMQYYLGVCGLNDIATCIACPVVAKNESRSEIIIYGGAVHLSKESLLSKNAVAYFGLVVNFEQNGWGKPLSDTIVASLSQEHGIIKTTPSVFNDIQRGDTIGILPVHSCLSNDLLKDHHQIINKRY